ncbi:polysaccharide deacetylase family protein [Marinobacter aromaticivorans]|uniref:Polysaccharide deacetylase family protein n=1 Tax=Marinobacter aromaticivorans TaxID=1494078 RepID=A0ABW2IXL4_9GAMM|nr:polysaccharide deacetylase family protein [Marinobacter aromaticivorans]
MQLVKPILKQARYSLFAAVALLRIKLKKSPSLIILTYHRILPGQSLLRHTEQPGMIATPEALDMHLSLLKRLGAEFVSLDTWLDAQRKNKGLPRLAVAVTFDDGWQDNYEHAFPVLKKHSIPATIFLVSQRINTSWLFWPEQVLDLLINHFHHLGHEALQWLRPYLEASDDPSSPYTILQADSVINRLKALDDHTIETHLEQTRNTLPALGQTTPSARPLLNKQELDTMLASGLITYGAHTRHHYRLNHLGNQTTLENEIVGSHEDLEKLGLQPVRIFCYPNGDITGKGEQLVQQHFTAACTTERGWNRTPPNPFGLRRFNFHDGNGSTPLSFLATLGRP